MSRLMNQMRSSRPHGRGRLPLRVLNWMIAVFVSVFINRMWPLEQLSVKCRKQCGYCFDFATLHCLIGPVNSAIYPTDQNRSEKQLRLGHAHFTELGATCLFPRLLVIFSIPMFDCTDNPEWGFTTLNPRCVASYDLDFTPAYLVQCSSIHCVWRKHFFLWHTEQSDSYILSDVLVCSIAKYFYKLYRTLTRLAGLSKYKQQTT